MADHLHLGEQDPKELAFLYDLYIAPTWRERFDELVDAEVALPAEGMVLDAGCGTGGYAVETAAKLAGRLAVVGVDPSPERLALARAKAETQKVKGVEFVQGMLAALGLKADGYDLVIGDASMLPTGELGAALRELARVARPGATVALKLTTRGSFDEFFSIYWEALHDLGLEEFTPQLEGLITERLTATQAQESAAAAGLRHVRSVTRKERFDFEDAAAFLASPLIATSFLGGWLDILPDAATARRVRDALVEVIDRERYGMEFDISIKATLVVGQK